MMMEDSSSSQDVDASDTNVSGMEARRPSYQNQASEASSGSFRRRRSSRRSKEYRRRGSLLHTIKRAFSLDYHAPPDIDDLDYEDEDEEEGDSMSPPSSSHHDKNHHRSQCKCTWIQLAPAVAILLVLLILATFITHGPPEPLPDGERASGSSGPKTDTNDDKVCGDPIMALRSFSELSGVKRGAVAADHPLCSNLGLEILRDHGGNAVDAIVAVALCLGVANPASSGLGGGAFILVHAEEPEGQEPLPLFHDARSPSDKDQQALSGKITEVIDCREVAPSAATTDMYKGKPDSASVQGGLAIGVPGELKGLELAHARHGRLPWAKVVEPAMELAESGVPVNPNLAHEIALMAKLLGNKEKKYVDYGLRALLTHNDSWDSPLKEGDKLRNTRLAETLRRVRDEGSAALYTGDLAARLAEEIQDAGGITKKEDIENYRATLRSPVAAHGIHGFSIVGVPPPSSGGAAIIGAARYLSGFKTPLASFPNTLSVHRMVEACKHAFAIRMSLSDPLYNSETVSDAVHDLIEGPYMEELREASSDNSTLSLSQYGGSKWAQLHDSDAVKSAVDAQEGDRRLDGRRFGYLDDHGTSHISVVDGDGNAASMTTSVNTYFGSTVVSKSTGIVLSNTMDDFGNPGRPNYFGLHPSAANFIKPGKKPLSSMSPTMVFRSPAEGQSNVLGDLMLVLGASGGPKIISAVFRTFANVVLLGMPLFEAVVHPRVHDQLIYHGAAATTTEKSVLEQGQSISVSQRTREALKARGHALIDVNYEGTVQGISIDLETNELTAVCDVRKGGAPAGY